MRSAINRLRSLPASACAWMTASAFADSAAIKCSHNPATVCWPVKPKTSSTFSSPISVPQNATS